MGLLVMFLLLSACGRDASPPVDPYVPYRPALKPEFQDDFERMDKAPRYYLTVALTSTAELLTGVAEIDVTNYSSDPWRYLVFRLYPALPQYGGEMVIQGAGGGSPADELYLPGREYGSAHQSARYAGARSACARAF